MNRELNERIAVEVMGLKIYHKIDGTPYLLADSIPGSYGYGNYVFPDFCGDIAAAWLVVEELTRKLECIFDLEIRCAGSQFYARFIRYVPDEDGDPRRCSGDSDWRNTAPLAICYAALEICAKLRRSPSATGNEK